MVNTLLAESATRRIDCGFEFCRQIRVQDTLYKILDEHRGSDQPWGRYLLTCALRCALNDTVNIGLRLRILQAQLVRLIGPLPDEPATDLTGVRSSDNGRAVRATQFHPEYERTTTRATR